MKKVLFIFVVSAVAAFCQGGPVQSGPASDSGPTLNAPHNAPVGDLLNMKGVDRPSALTGVTIEQRLNSQVPLDLPFRDENGKAVKLSDYFRSGRPVVLALVYYDCPM